MNWIDTALAGQGPLYLRIVNALEQAVHSGAQVPGQRLPSQRALATRLGIDLTTVTRAFGEGRRRGLVESRGPQGSFVAPPGASTAQAVDLSMNVPPVPDTVALAAALRRGAATVLARSSTPELMTYHLGGGSQTDRHAASTWLRPMLGEVDAATLVVSEGAQAALAAIIIGQTCEGEAILCDPLVYPGLLQVAGSLRRRLVAVTGDAEGMCPDMLERAALAYPARLVYFNPTCHNPTALTVPPRRRQDLARVLRRLRLLAVEDDPYWHHEPAMPVPLARLAPEHVYYLSTLSKAISPGLRTAFVRCPSAAHATRLADALRATRLMGHPLLTALASQLLLDGSAGALLAQVRDEAHERVALATHLLAPSLHARVAGLHAWCQVPAPWTGATLAQAARLQNLAITSSGDFAADAGTPADGARLSLGRAPDRLQLQRALRRINQLVDGRGTARVQG